MKPYITILISTLLFSSNISAQNRIMSYGSFLSNWVEFYFYDDGTYQHLVHKKRGLGHTTTNGKYATHGDTIILLDKIQHTYKHGNRSSKFLKSGDSLLVDLDILWGYTALENFTSLKQKAKKLRDANEEERWAFFITYAAEIQQIKFPYEPLEDETQIRDLNIVLQDFFNHQVIRDFFVNNTTIMVRFFYKVDHIFKISVPQKVIEFIKSIIEKTLDPKRVDFQLFYILDDHKTIFFNVMLYGGRRSKNIEYYSAEYKKENENWTLNFIRKEKLYNGFLF